MVEYQSSSVLRAHRLHIRPVPFCEIPFCKMPVPFCKMIKLALMAPYGTAHMSSDLNGGMPPFSFRAQHILLANPG
jgi:hypothetical protein